jgi:hypothetical protein
MGLHAEVLTHAIVDFGQEHGLTIFAGNQTETVWHFGSPM